MSRVRMSHVTCANESWHACECVRSHCECKDFADLMLHTHSNPQHTLLAMHQTRTTHSHHIFEAQLYGGRVGWGLKIWLRIGRLHLQHIYLVIHLQRCTNVNICTYAHMYSCIHANVYICAHIQICTY